MLLEIILIYAVFVFSTIIINYYSNLLLEKDEYTKDELKLVFSYTQKVIEKILKRYSLPPFTVSSLLGVFLTLITNNILMNSSLIFVILFFILPVIKNYLSKSQVTYSETYVDSIANILIKYNILISLGFGFGTGCALIHSWAASRIIPFPWFLINLAVVVFLLNSNLRKMNSK